MLTFKKYEEPLRMLVALIPISIFILLSNPAKWYESLQWRNLNDATLLMTCLVLIVFLSMPMLAQIGELRARVKTWPLVLLSLFWSQNFFLLYQQVYQEFAMYYANNASDNSPLILSSSFVVTCVIAGIFSAWVFFFNDYLKDEGHFYTFIKWVFIVVVFAVVISQNADEIHSFYSYVAKTASWLDKNIFSCLGSMPEFDKPVKM